MTKCIKGRLHQLMAGTLLFAGLQLSAVAKPTELRMGFYQNDSHLFVQVAKEIFPKLAERTEGRYEFGIYASESIGKASEQIDITQRGLAFGNLICTCYYPGTFPLFSIETVPIWTQGENGVQETFEGGLAELYQEYLHDRGLENIGVLGSTAYSVRSLGMRKGEPHLPADLKGKRIRGLGYESVLIRGSGGSVLTMPMPHVMEALERNMLDGVIAQESNWIDWKLYETLESIAFLDLTTSPMTIIYSIRDLNAMSADDQKAVLEVLEEYRQKLTTAYGQFMSDSRDFLQEDWEGHAYYLTPEERGAFIEVAGGAAAAEFLEKNGEYGQKALELVEKYNPPLVE